jgi:protein tyrosine phosphatase (PTP) superfamily phosphohydrolase (DUF442 family)
MANLAKRTRRQIKQVTLGWRKALVEKAPDWAKRALAPTVSYIDMLLLDHGVFRLVYVNQHRLSELAWRSAQPAPHHIKSLARRGIRTIVNLRGERLCGSYWLEREACRRYGIKLVDFQVRSRAAPSLAELRAARELFDRIEYPVLMHCKSGADRAGLMSVLYRYLKEGVPIEQAKCELSLRYGHIRHADTGILDYFFERYLQDTRERPMPFFDWVEQVYDPEELKRSFKARGWANQIVGRVLRRE